jgi:hypothetical protein
MESPSKKEQPMIAQKTFLPRHLAISLALICCAAFAAPSAASAAQRYAAPNGGAAASCSQADPCSLQTAVESAAAGDEVIVGPGTYSEGSNQLAATKANMSIHGAAGQPRPQINFTNMPGVAMLVGGGGNADLHHLKIDSASGGTALRVVNTGGVAEDLEARGSLQGACEIYSESFRLRDSVCVTNGSSYAAVNGNNQLPNSTFTLTLRNVTAIATGSSGFGLYAGASGNASKLIVDAKNVIANGGTAGISADIMASNTGGPNGEATVNLANSNYNSRCEYVGGSCNGGAGVSITAPGSGTNQTAAPVFTDSAFHQDAASPTVDKGTTDGEVGTADPDGDQRSLGAAVDIGADEYGPPAPPPPPPPPPADPADPSDPPATDPPVDDPPVSDPADTDPPETTIKKAPPTSLQRTTVGFRFVSDEPGSTFRCKLDRGAFRPCVSGRRYRHLTEGKHRFQVVAVDAAGNADPTSARARFRVLEG